MRHHCKLHPFQHHMSFETFLEAATEGNTPHICICISLLPTDVLETGLTLACRNNHLEIVKVLLTETNVDVNVNTDTLLKNPLRQAAKSGHFEIVSLLLKFGAKPDSIWCRTEYYICKGGHASVMKLLIEASAAKEIQKMLDSFLVCASQENQPTLVQYLLSVGADPSIRDHYAINYAAAHGLSEAVSELIRSPVYTDTTLLKNPLKRALHAGHDTTTKILVDAGARIHLNFKQSQ